MAKNRTKRLLKETGWFALGNFGSKLLALILIPFYTSILSTSQYGIIDIITTTVNLTMPILTLLIYEAAFRFLLDVDQNKKQIISMSVVICIVSSLIIIPLFPVFRRIYEDLYTYRWYIFFIYLTGTLSTTMSNCMKGIDKSNIYAFQGMIYTGVFAVLNILFLAVYKMGIPGYLLSLIIANSAACIFMIIFGKVYEYFSFGCFSKKLLTEMLKYSIPLIPASVAWWIMTSIDKYMLLYMCNETANGLYNAAHKIPTIISVLTTFFINAWQISAIRNKDDEDAAEYLSGLYEIMFLFGSLMGFGLIILSQPIGKIMYAKDFYSAWTMTPPLTAATVFSTFSLFFGAQFTASKRSDLHLKSNVISMVFNVILNYIFIKSFGINGAAYGTMLSYFLVLIYRIVKVKTLVDFKYNRLKHQSTYLLLMICAIVTAFNIHMYVLIDIVLIAAAIVINLKEYIELIKKLKLILHNFIRKGEKV